MHSWIENLPQEKLLNITRTDKMDFFAPRDPDILNLAKKITVQRMGREQNRARKEGATKNNDKDYNDNKKKTTHTNKEAIIKDIMC